MAATAMGYNCGPRSSLLKPYASPLPRLNRNLPIRGPYHLGQTLSVLTMGKGNPWLRHNDTQGQIALNTPAGRVAIAATHRNHRLEIVADGPATEWIKPHLAGLFGLEDALDGFHPTGKLGQLARQHAGLRLVRLPIVFDRLVQVVLQQLIAFRDACRGWRQLVQRFGDEVPGSGGLYFAPTAQTIASLATYELMECDILPKHARLILTLAKQAHAIEQLWNAGQDDNALDRLTDYLVKQPGVGEWTVGYLRGAGLGDADAVVPGDYGHPHQVAYFFTAKERSDDAEMLRLLEPYRPHRFRVLMLLILGAALAPRYGPRRASLRERFR